MTRSSPRLWASAAALVLAACGEDLTPPPSSDLGPATRPDGGGTSAENILQTLRSGDWGVLAREAERAGLAELLAGPDILTFFAPSDLAFANPSAAVPSDPGLLANLLLHHLVSGEVDEAALRGSGELTSRAGTRLGIEPGPPLRVGGTSLSVPRDLRAGNGLIHGVDAVMRPPRIDEVMASEAELSVLRAALVRASPEVQAVLSGPGPVTLWAPVDSAFGDLDPTQLDPREIDALLRAHVVGGQALSAEMRDGQILTSAQGTELVVLREDARPLSLVDVSGSTVATLAPEQRLANGILHRVDGVLNAGQEGPDDLLDVIPQTGLTALGTAVSEAGVAPAFRSSEPLTVFAPTDAAFFAARALPPEPELLANVLLHHVVVGAVSSSQLAEAAPLTTAAGTRLRVEATIPPAVDGVSLATPVDQLASNGVLHVVDGVMLPPPIGAAVRERSDLSTWARAVDAAGADVAAALDGAAPITVFAPVNSSFGGVDLDALFVDVERLTDLLSYHVAPGQRLAENLRDGQVLAMANGAPLVVEVDGDAVTVRDGLGVRANVTASVRLLNGTVHVVDQLLNPGNLLEQGRDRGFVTWTGLVRRVGLDAVLRSPGPLTAFVPTQAAFASWGVDLGPVDDGVVTNLLLAHLVAGRRPSAAVASATTLSSLGGLSLSVGSAPTSVGGASLSTPLDVEASNGILHALDAVIVPSALPEVAAAVVDLSTTLTALNQASPSTQAALSPDTLTGSPPVTVFAPLDNAFIGQNIDVTTMAAADLDALLGHHVVRGQILSRDLAAGPLMVTTLGGATLVLDQQGTTITIVDETGGQGRIDGVLRDLRTLNGILHVIDRVLQGP